MSDEKTIYDRSSFTDDMTAFDDLYACDDPFEFEKTKIYLRESAKSCGLAAREFNSLLKGYEKRRQKPRRKEILILDNFDYRLGDWSIDKATGKLFKICGEQAITACSHPVFIEKKLLNIITGERKVQLKFTRDRGKTYRTVIVNKSVIATAASITQLNEAGISVTSDNAKMLVLFLQNFEDLNYDRIEEVQSVNRFGWIDQHRFSPYEDDIVFDSQESFREIRSAVDPSGTFDGWLDAVRPIWQSGDIAARIMLAASFSSVLIGPLDCLPFFVHLWGGTENGKTVALMLAASVWADPTIGRYAKSFNSTAVAQETIAGLLYNMPLIMDELQSINDRKSFDKLIYELTEGTGRARGNTVGGLRETLTWRNCMLSSGEQPITKTLSGGGAKNRIIEMECKDKLFENPVDLCEALKNNYGHAGRKFVEFLTDEIISQARSIRIELYQQFLDMGYTEKQAMTASIIMTADQLVGAAVFGEPGRSSIGMDEMGKYLLTADEVSKEKQSYEWLRGWIAANDNKFYDDAPNGCWGKKVLEGTAVISGILREACEDAGVSFEVLTSYLDDIGKLTLDSKGKRSKQVKINGHNIRCYVIINEFGDD